MSAHQAESRAGPSSSRIAARSSTLSADKVSRLQARDDRLSALAASFLTPDGSEAASPSSRRAHAGALARTRKLLERDWPRADARSAEAIRGLSLKHDINLQPSLSIALPARYADLQRSVEANERLEREIDDRNLRLREEARRRGDDTNKAVKTDPTGLMHKKLVEDIMEALLQLAQPATLETETYAALLLGDEDAVAGASHKGKGRQPTSIQQLEVEEPLRGEGWEGPEAGDVTWSDESFFEEEDLRSSGDSETSWDQSEDETDAIVRGWRREKAQALRRRRGEGQRQQGPEQEREAERVERSEALQAAAGRAVGSDPASLTELEAVREALFALDGVPNRLVEIRDGQHQPISRAPRPQHFLPKTWTELLLALARHCRTLHRLTTFAAAVAERSRSSLVRISQAHTSTIGLESFTSRLLELLAGYAATRARWADAVSFGTQAEERGERSVAGMLTLMDDLERQGAPFEALESVIDSLGLWSEEQRAKEGALNALVDALQRTILFHSTSMGGSDLSLDGADAAASSVVQVLESCFLAALEPIWSDVKSWIELGMTAPGAAGGTFAGAGADIWHRNFFATAAREAFARSATSDDPWLWAVATEEVPRLDSEIEDGETQSADLSDSPRIPLFLASIAPDIFTTGRSVGLLNALGDPLELGSIVGNGSASDLVDGDLRSGDGDLGLSQTDRQADKVHGALFGGLSRRPSTSQRHSRQASTIPDELESASGLPAERSPLPLRLSEALAAHLSPTFSIVRKRLADLLLTAPWEGGCGLLAHLTAMQGLFLWQRGGGWDVLTEELYKKMDAGLEHLNDPYILNGIFKDDAAVEEWIDPSLVRFKLPSRPKTEDDDPAGLEWLGRMQIQYAVPWPLTYCFTPQTMETYQAISTLLLQLHRARAVIDRPSKIKGRTLLARIAAGGPREQQTAMTLGLAPRSALGAKTMGLSKTMRRMTALRARAAWILRVLQRYLTVDVLEPQCNAAKERLGTLSSFDDIIADHSHFVSCLRRQCLLASDQANWTEAMHEILRLSTVCGKLFEEDICGESGADQVARRQKKGATGARKARQQRSASDDEDEAPQDEEDDEGAVASRKPSSTPSGTEADLLARIIDVDEELKANISVLLGGAERMVVRCSLSARERERPSHSPAPTLEERDSWQDLAYELRLGGAGKGASPGPSGRS